jgi:hypothetical protein
VVASSSSTAPSPTRTAWYGFSSNQRLYCSVLLTVMTLLLLLLLTAGKGPRCVLRLRLLPSPFRLDGRVRRLDATWRNE